MVLYIEACESGSMFNRHKLPKNINSKWIQTSSDSCHFMLITCCFIWYTLLIIAKFLIVWKVIVTLEILGTLLQSQDCKFPFLNFWIEFLRLQNGVLYMHSNISWNFMASFILVFATTAANAAESSYACYYDKKLDTYLGDVYSVKWLENSDHVRETLSNCF